MDYQLKDALGKCGTSVTVSDLLEAVGADAGATKAVWLSYPVAAFVRRDQFGEVRDVDCALMRTYGEGDCMADALRAVIDEMRLENDCTCTFGHEGAYQLSTILTDACNKRGKPTDIALLRDLAPVMRTQSICDEGRAMGRVVEEALDLFASEIEPHFQKRQCPTGGCAAFKTYHILVSKCTGCGKCLKACDDKAIMGKPHFIHVIDQRKCSQCDQCRRVCPAKAIVRAGAKKPKTSPRPIPIKRK